MAAQADLVIAERQLDDFACDGFHGRVFDLGRDVLFRFFGSPGSPNQESVSVKPESG